MLTDEIREALLARQDLSYRDFQTTLLPTVASERIIGVRTPEIRAIAKNLIRRPDAADFLCALPHRYFDEDQVHALALGEIKTFDGCLAEVERFLPYIDNWATCDQLSPKCFRRERAALLPRIRAWLASDRTYTVRFAIGMLMQHYLDEAFSPEYPALVAAVRSDEYYINMMIAWYFATALAKQYDAVLPYLTERRLDRWVHNKTIQKAIESRRISEAQKAGLRKLRIRGA